MRDSSPKKGSLGAMTYVLHLGARVTQDMSGSLTFPTVRSVESHMKETSCGERAKSRGVGTHTAQPSETASFGF